MAQVPSVCTMANLPLHRPQEKMKQASEFDVVVTTYEMLSSEANFFKRRFLWELVIVDEGHRLKNEKSQLSQKLKQASRGCRLPHSLLGSRLKRASGLQTRMATPVQTILSKFTSNTPTRSRPSGLQRSLWSQDHETSTVG